MKMDEENRSSLAEELLEFGLAETRSDIRVLTIIGQIEGHFIAPEQNKTTKYEHILPLLVAMEEDPEVKGILILLNTMGGDVEAGLAIAELIASMKTPTVSLVLGGGHSIGVPLACAARRSFIASTATMLLHPVRATGTVIGVSQSFRAIEAMQNRICRFIEAHSTISPEKLMLLILSVGKMAGDVGTILSGEEAVAEGLIDEVGGLDKALAALKEMIEKDRENDIIKE